MLTLSRPVVLLASPDLRLTGSLEMIFDSLGLRVTTITHAEAVLLAMESLASGSILLLDFRMPGIANGQLMAAIEQSGVHNRCPIALIAGLATNAQISEEWILRLREGVIDDIVPRNADATAWATHLSTMQRSYHLGRELAHLRETAETQVQHDRLTGTFNRDTILSILFRETDRVQRLRGALCFVLLDIDDFGHWNQELGTDACDQLLQQVAARTGRILRSYDLLGRMGGDEFLLALPGCSTVNAVMLTERLRMDVFGELFEVEREPGRAVEVRLTACVGITSSRGRSPVVVLREAEETLHRARLAGPDSIRCASESPLAAELEGAEVLFSEHDAVTQ